jgi:hypothetical protein
LKEREGQIDLLDEHAPIYDRDVCNEDDRETIFYTPLELAYEGNDIRICDGQDNSPCDTVSQSTSTSYHCYDAYDYLGVSTPKYDEDLALEELPLEVDLPSQELFTKEKADFEKCEEEDKSENLIEEDCSHEPHHWTGQLKVRKTKL